MSGETTFAPIALFIYKRSDLLGAVLDSLEACPEFSRTQVYVFSDGPKDASAAEPVEQARALVRARLRPNMRLIESQANMGLSRSIVKGVTQLCDEAGKVIVIEDDLIVSPAILTWFNQALDRFADDGRVFQVSGHVSGRPGAADDAGMFASLTTSWGWATWQRAWRQFDPEARGCEELKSDAAMRRAFDLDGTARYSAMLFRQMAGEIDSWAIRWYWTVFKSKGLVLFPPTTLVANKGDDRSATHGRSLKRFRALFRRSPPALPMIAPKLPGRIEASPVLLRAVRRANRLRLFS
jgi:hypothetical protein